MEGVRTAMNTLQNGFARIAALFALFLSAPAGMLVAQQGDNPVYVNVSFQEHFFSTSYPYGGSMYVSLMDETGATVYTYVYAAPAYQWTSSSTVTAKLVPNKNYTVSISASGGFGYVLFETALGGVGGEITMDGVVQYERSIAADQYQTFSLRVKTGEAYQNLGAGQGSSIADDKPIWYLGLGRIRSGESAGSIGFRRDDFSDTNFFKPDALIYDSVDPAEVDVIRQSGILRQVFSREVLVDIQTIVSGTSYKLDVFPRSQVGSLSGGVYLLSGSPFASYTISKISPTGGIGVKITRTEDSVIWETSLEQVASTWTLRDWRVQGATADSKITTNYTTSTAATVSHSGPPVSGTGTETPLVWKKTFTQQSWGKELNTVTYGENETTPLVTQHSYYTSTGSGGVQKYLKWLKQPNGSWSKFDYYDSSTTSGDRGMPKRIYRQWLDMSADPNSPSTSDSAYEDWTYVAALDGSYRLPSSRTERAPGGTILSKTEWVYNHAITTLNGKTIAQSIRYDYWGTGGTDRLAVTTQYYRENDSTPYLRMKPASVTYPDGRKDSYAYFNGTWSDSTRTFTASSGGDDRLILCYHGQTSGGTSVSSATNNGITWAMSTVSLVANKSTISEVVVDTHGRVVFEGERIYHSSGDPARIAGVIHRFDTHGREYETVDVVRSVGTSGGDEFKTVRTFSSGLLTFETAPEGRGTKFEYDLLLRLKKKIDHYVDGFGGPSGYPEKVTELKYDGANRLEESYSCSCGTGATIYTYDGAGRIESQSEAAPGGGNLMTSHYYANVRRVETTLPTGATRIVENFYDSRPKSITGSAQPPVTFEYVAESTGMKITRKNGSDTTNGWVEEKFDWLGRPTVRSVPTWGWPSVSSNNVLETQFNYNSAGQLWRERTYYRASGQYITADRLFVYDSGGRLWRRGVDINNNGQLDEASNDRIVDTDNNIVPDVWGWVRISVAYTYPISGTTDWIELSRVHQRLVGFGDSAKSAGRFVIGDVVSFDQTGRWSLRWDYANPSTKSIESDYQFEGFPQGAYQKGYNGYPSEELRKNGEKVGYVYDSRGRLSHVYGRWTGSAYAEDTAYTYHGETPFVASVTHGGIATSYAFAWDDQNINRTVTVTDAAGKTTHTLFNAMDLPWRVWGSAAQPVQFGYDAVGRRTSMTTWRAQATSGDFGSSTWPSDPGTGATTTWDLEAATGLLEHKIWADHVEIPTSGNRKWTYTYTPLGNVSTRTWARGVTTTYSYFDGSTTSTSDISHRTHELRKIDYSDATFDPTYTYLRTGAPYQITDFTGTRTFAYRSDQQLASETLDSTFYGSNRTITPTYEDGTGGTVNGRGTGFQFKTGGTSEVENTFAFNPSTGRISTIAGKSGSPTFTFGYATGAHWVELVTSGSYARTNTLLSNRRILDRVETKWSGTSRSDYDSTFDSRGLRASVVQSGSIPTAGTTTFTYNDRAELTVADFSVGTSKDFTWGYDMMGKRTTAVNNGSTTTYNAVAAVVDVNQYASITGGMAESGLAYDEDGNMKEDGTWYYRYDGENRLKEMEKKNGTQTLQFAYDYLNRRVRKTVRNGGPSGSVASSAKFVWSGWALTAELDAGTGQTGSTFLKSYLWGVDFSNGSGAAGGAGALLAVYQNGAWYHTAYDAMGNLTGYLDTNGNVAASYEYNAYGQIVASGGSATSFAFGFATQYTDHESGLVYYGMRYYQPKHGRFINRDPIEEAGGLNLYSFTHNNPANAWDLLGLDDTEILQEYVIVGDRTQYEWDMARILRAIRKHRERGDTRSRTSQAANSTTQQVKNEPRTEEDPKCDQLRAQKRHAEDVFDKNIGQFDKHGAYKETGVGISGLQKAAAAGALGSMGTYMFSLHKDAQLAMNGRIVTVNGPLSPEMQYFNRATRRGAMRARQVSFVTAVVAAGIDMSIAIESYEQEDYATGNFASANVAADFSALGLAAAGEPRLALAISLAQFGINGALLAAEHEMNRGVDKGLKEAARIATNTYLAALDRIDEIDAEMEELGCSGL